MYKTDIADQTYLSALGPITRSLAFHEENGFIDRLYTGSLKYYKALLGFLWVNS